MSNPTLPAELLDHITDHLDTRRALGDCCLVSKLWIPRTRKHLFASIEFRTAVDLESWKKKFPDPSTSPACYTKALTIGCPEEVTVADAEVGGWIRGFSHIVHLELKGYLADNLTPLFHGFSPTIKSLDVNVIMLSPSHIFNLILSFPLLEDLRVTGWEVRGGGSPDGLPTVIQPSNPPIFTGSLELHHGKWTKPFTRRLLSLPGGIHFRKLTLTYMREEDASLVMALVLECSHSLESLEISGTRSSK